MSSPPDTSEAVGGETPSAIPPSTTPSGPSSLLDEHPEALAGAAFVGGLLTALIVRRLGR